MDASDVHGSRRFTLCCECLSFPLCEQVGFPRAARAMFFIGAGTQAAWRRSDAAGLRYAGFAMSERLDCKPCSVQVRRDWVAALCCPRAAAAPREPCWP